MICIFCLCEKDDQYSVEHIIPESLGGGDWAILPPDTFCDACNHYFGSKIESKVLLDYALNILRLFSGVITKKRKWAGLSHPIGKLQASPYGRMLGLDPSDEEVETKLRYGKRTQFRVLAQTKDPLLMCRFLLKIALECIARDRILDAITVEYAAARRFARNPRTGDRWWFMYRCDPAKDGGPGKAIEAEIVDLEGAEMAIITIFGCNFFVPLTSRITYGATEDLREPEYRYFFVQQ